MPDLQKSADSKRECDHGSWRWETGLPGGGQV